MSAATSDRPGYREIAIALRARIESAEFPPGTALPSEAALVAEFSVARDTVRQALPQLDPHGGAYAHIADWASKHTGACVRIAGLLHLAAHLRNGYSRPVDAPTMRAAVAIGEYYAAHALAAFEAMGADPVHDNARALLDWIMRVGCASFTRRDAFTHNSRARFAKVADLDPALALLEQHGYIQRAAPSEPTGRRGRPASATWLVHPTLVDRAGHQGLGGRGEEGHPAASNAAMLG